jgi:tetratricopeptide (TPR) repeat protein
MQFGEFDDATAAVRRCIEIAQPRGNHRIEAQALGLMATIAMTRGLLRDAEECFQRALTLSRHGDDPSEQLGYLQGLARLGLISGQPQVAIRNLHQALDIAALYASPETRARLHGQLGRLHGGMHQLRDAEEHYLSSLAAAEEAGALPLQARALRGLASTQDSAGNLDAAVVSYARAAELADQLGDLRNAAALRYNLGAILHDRGNDDEARDHLNHSLECAMSSGDYTTADAARELLRWLSPANAGTNHEQWGEDLLLDEMAVNDEGQRLREPFRG